MLYFSFFLIFYNIYREVMTILWFLIVIMFLVVAGALLWRFSETIKNMLESSDAPKKSNDEPSATPTSRATEGQEPSNEPSIYATQE